VRTRALILAVALLSVGCGGGGGDSSGPAKGKANLKVTVVAKPKTGAKPFKSYQPTEAEKAEAAASKGAFELVDYDNLEGIVVYLVSGDTTAKTHPPAGVKIAVMPKPAKPPLSAASAGDTATVVNNGTKPMRLYSVSEGNEFDLGQIPAGGTKDQPLQSPGLIELLDGETFDVVARIYVAPGWGARLVPAGEATTFRDLDPGEYRVAAWHERLPGDERPVTLVADRTRELNLLIGVNALPKVE
jgi:hypothetical protein